MRYLPLLLIILFFFLPSACEDTIVIGSWNLERFGTAKLENPYYQEIVAALINQTNIFIIQEVTDKSNKTAKWLCSLKEQCYVSKRKGTSSYKESYVIVYNQSLNIINDSLDYKHYERPPLTFALPSLTITTIHTKPTAAQSELEALERALQDAQNHMIIGDLNADCDYLHQRPLQRWHWLLDSDTTTGFTDCTYDQIIASSRDRYCNARVLSSDSFAALSDHYPIVVEWEAVSP